MYVYALKVLNDQQLCEDIIQDIFISIWEKAPTTEIKCVEFYLFRALKYKIVNALRDEKYTEINNEHLSLLSSDNDVKNELEYNDLEAQVHKTIQALPEKCRNVFYLSRIEEYSNHEIAKKTKYFCTYCRNSYKQSDKIFKDSYFIHNDGYFNFYTGINYSKFIQKPILLIFIFCFKK